MRVLSSSVRRVAALAAAASLIAACSGDHGSDDAASVTTVGTTAAAADTTAAAVTTSPAAGVTTDAPTTTAPAGVTFGTLESPCGPGDAAGATAKGVTDSSITIGYGDDAGYDAAPGLDKEMSDAMKAMIGWCNEQGGINGRTIEGVYYDAKVLQVDPVITQACADDTFMLVGQGWVFDQGQEQKRIACQLSTIPGFAVATAFASGSGMVSPLPNPGDQADISSAFQLAKLFPEAVKKAALVFAEFPATRETRDKAFLSYPSAGWEFQDCDQIYNVSGESDWKPIASNLKACGIDAVVWVGSPDPNMENLLNASRQVGFEPAVWATDPNQYVASFAQWNAENDGAADNVYVRMTAVPFEFADQAPAVQQYMELVQGSGGSIGLLGEQSTSAFLLWATAVKACGSEVTAKCVLDQAAAQKEWTAGGLHLPADPGTNSAPSCGMLLKLAGGDWQKVAPTDDLFECDDSYRVTGLQTDAVKAALLNADRVATQFGTFEPA